MSRDSQTDASRTGTDVPGRAAFMYDCPEPISTIWEEKQALKDTEPTSGTRGACDIPVAES